MLVNYHITVKHVLTLHMFIRCIHTVFSGGWVCLYLAGYQITVRGNLNINIGAAAFLSACSSSLAELDSYVSFLQLAHTHRHTYTGKNKPPFIKLTAFSDTAPGILPHIMMITKKGLSLHWVHCKANRGLQTRRAICPYLTSRKSKKPSGCSLFWTQSAAGWNTVCMTDKRRIMHQVCLSNHGMCNGHVDT